MRKPPFPFPFVPLFTAIMLWITLVPSTTFAQLPLPRLPGSDEPRAVTVQAAIRPGDSPRQAVLHVEATIQAGHYIYAIDTPEGSGPVPTEIRIVDSGAARIGRFRALTPPETKFSEVFGTEMRTHAGKVSWTAPIDLPEGVDCETAIVTGTLYAQACAPNLCVRPQEYPFAARFAAEEMDHPASTPEKTPVTMLPANQRPGSDTPLMLPPPNAADPTFVDDQISGGVSAVSFQSTDSGPTAAIQDNAISREKPVAVAVDNDSVSIGWVLGLAFFGGLLLNLMPCVLPVIGLKVLSFVEQSGHNRARTFWLNAWYALGLLTVFWILAGLAAFLGFGWGQLFTYGGFNIALSAVVFVMGLSFLGVWEIPIPGFVGSGRMAELEQKEGAGGAFAKGMITTVLATPCTAPLLGTALAWALRQPPFEIFLVFTAVGLGMASPYLLAGVFPQVTSFLPKPGAWMETFKQVMGFVLMGTVVYLLTILRWYYVVPTIGFLFGLWAACWWIGKTPVTASGGTKRNRWIQAGAFAALVWFLMFAGSPIGFSSFEESSPVRGLACVMKDRLESRGAWKPFNEKDLGAELAKGKPVVVDFTADWCLVCKTLEATVLKTDSVKEALLRHDAAAMRADWTHGDPEVTRMLDRLGSKQVPLIAVFSPKSPDRPVLFRGGMTERMLLEALERAGSSS